MMTLRVMNASNLAGREGAAALRLRHGMKGDSALHNTALWTPRRSPAWQAEILASSTGYRNLANS
jgi:hypothetical protein